MQAPPPDAAPIGEHTDLWSQTAAYQLWGLRTDRAQMDHATLGGVPLQVRTTQQAWRDRAEHDPDRFFRHDVETALSQSVKAAARFSNATDGRFWLVHSIATAVSSLIDQLRLRPGDEVLVTNHADPRLRTVVARAAARAGARLATARVPAMAGAADWRDILARSVTSRTRLAVLEQVTAVTSEIAPVSRIAPALRQAGVAVLVDGTPAIGQLSQRISDLGADAWVAGYNTWACGPRGVAGCWTRDGSGLEIEEETPDVDIDWSAWCSLPEAFRFLHRLGLDRLRAGNAVLASYGQSVVAEALGASDQLPGHPRLAVRAVPVSSRLIDSPQRASSLQAQIADALKTRIGVSFFEGQGWLRLSAQAYNWPDQYDWLTYGLRDLIRTVPRG